MSLLGLLIVGAAACGGTTPVTSTSTSTTTKVAPTGLAAYRTCLTDHGIPATALGGRRPGGGPSSTPGSGTFPSTTLPAGVTQQQYQGALTACRSERPTGRFGPGGVAGPQSAAFKAYTNCLQLHGAALPGRGGFSTTSTTGASSTTAASTTLATAGPTFQAAQQACASLRPTFAGPGATTTTTQP
ncbi:MAG TPA: hypothetical protein VG184_13340 [Acidimicrobiales bacterium]|nr:hypothetical protein [Acidimicrobiales bacterium]